MLKAFSRVSALLLMLWLPLHFGAQVTPPIVAMIERSGAPGDTRPDSRRRRADGLPPALSAYLGAFGIVRAYGFFSDVRYSSFQLRSFPAQQDAPADVFPPVSWTGFGYDLFQLRLFEALAFDGRVRRRPTSANGAANAGQRRVRSSSRSSWLRDRSAPTDAPDYVLSERRTHSCR